MADTKLTALTEISIPALEDLLYVVDDPSGTPASVKLTARRLGGLLGHFAPQLRLTTETGVPVSPADRTAQGTLYATPSTPCGHSIASGFLRTYDGTRIRLQEVTSDPSLSLAIVSGAVQDIFIKDSDLSLVAEYWKNSTVTITIATPGVVTWTAHGLNNGDSIVFATSGALPTGLTAGAKYYLVNQGTNDFQLALNVGGAAITTSGTQSGTHTAYVIGVAAGNTTDPRTNALAKVRDLIVSGADNTFLWLGTIRASGANVTADSGGGVTTQVGGFRYVWNAYNQVPRYLNVIDTANGWSYSGAFRAANAAAANSVSYVTGHVATKIRARLLCNIAISTVTSGVPGVAIGVDTSLAASGVYNEGYIASTPLIISPAQADYNGLPGVGAHTLFWIERGATATTCQFNGDDTGVAQSGLQAEILA